MPLITLIINMDMSQTLATDHNGEGMFERLGRCYNSSN